MLLPLPYFEKTTEEQNDTHHVVKRTREQVTPLVPGKRRSHGFLCIIESNHCVYPRLAGMRSPALPSAQVPDCLEDQHECTPKRWSGCYGFVTAVQIRDTSSSSERSNRAIAKLVYGGQLDVMASLTAHKTPGSPESATWQLTIKQPKLT